MSFSSIIQKYKTTSFSKKDQGYKFERLMKEFISSSSWFAGDGIDRIWLWSEFPSRKDFGSGQDTGIDLVVHTKDGQYWAVQCKCYSRTTQIDKTEVDSFITTSGRSFTDVDDFTKRIRFSRRLWFDTSGCGFTKNAEDALKNQNPPVTRYGFFSLADSDVDWDKLEEGLTGEDARIPQYKIKDHQQDAIDAAHDYFGSHDNGKLIMACGTGKTFTSLKIVENETKDIKTPRVLFLAPSIALVGQTLKEWKAQASKPIHGVCICSDPKVSKKFDDSDSTTGESVVDLAEPASTDPADIEMKLRRALDSQKIDGGLVVVFSTYQSIDVVNAVQNRFFDSFKFDFCVCDEAHRTTGVSIDGVDESNFIRVHNKDFIKADKRLYMTATPRYFDENSKRRAEESSATLWSMDKPEFGEEFYKISFGDAVQKDLLTDYKVLVLTISEEEMSAELQNSLYKEGVGLPVDTSLKLIGCINALSKITKQTDLLKTSDPGLMHNAIAFCQNIKTSKKLKEEFKKLENAYYNTLSEESRENVVHVEARHIDGTMSATDRAEALSWLKNVDKESSQCNMLLNVRCLSEGVDVPSLDAVLFLAGKNNKTDVIQAVGRVMRKAPGKRYGYIIIPVFIPAGTKVEDMLGENKNYKVIWEVLNALRAHDERFESTLNKILLNKNKPEQILVGGVVNPEAENEDGDIEKSVEQKVYQQMELNFNALQTAIYTTMAEKCGTRIYWEQWAKDVAIIAQRHIAQIEKMISVDGSPARKAFDRYMTGLKKNINPYVDRKDAIEMLAQHFITQPIFEALFENYSFAKQNPISRSMQSMVRILNEQTPVEDNEKLERFYSSVKERVRDIDNAEGRQRVIVELYEKFFRTAFKTTTDKLGIVYTPVEIVDFIINSVEDILHKEFNRSMTDEGVHVLDPFTGTGTFIVRLLQSGIIRPEDLGRKYRNELHACEIVLLAYYIASINIENTFHDLMMPITEEEGQAESSVADIEKTLDFPSSGMEYQPFNGIVLTDTFQMTEHSDGKLEEVFPQNFERMSKLKKTPITVFIGNPPYSSGQGNGNANAQNEHYPHLEGRIADTYAALSSATLKSSLYDSYVKAFRWCTDRLAEFDETGRPVRKLDGIIGFVTNGSWLDGNAMAGVRRRFEEEFASIYVFNLRGNQRTSGELSKKEGGKIFGSGSRTSIAITILVRKKDFKGKAKIWYREVEDYQKREQKLALCRELGSVLSPAFKPQLIHPDRKGDWLNKTNDVFETYIPLGTKDQKGSANGFFNPIHTNGLKTQRDAWCYNFSRGELEKNMKATIDFYNSQREAYHGISGPRAEVIDFVDSDMTKISWTRALRNDLRLNKPAVFKEDHIVVALYRPFVKEYLYCDRQFNELVGIQSKAYPSPKLDNLVICVPGVGTTKEFTPLMTNVIPDLEIDSKTQCYPLYYYDEVSYGQGSLFEEEEVTYTRQDGVTDFILKRAREKYGPEVSKVDIFYYVYGILHSRSYAKKFSNDLKKALPRIPLVSDKAKFITFRDSGRKLADLHLNYEKIAPCHDVIVEGDKGDYIVDQMHFPQKDQKDTIIFNDDIKLTHIPAKAYEYIINGKSAVEWILERYRVKQDNDSGIVNDANAWGNLHGNPRYVLDLLLSVINVSCQTVDIINSLPDVDWDKE